MVRRVNASDSGDERTVIFRELGVDLPTDVRNLHTFSMSLMAYHLWATFEVSDSEAKVLFAARNRTPTWTELKPSSPVTEKMFGTVMKEVPAWWALADRDRAIAAERQGNTKANSPFTTQMSAIDLGDGFWRIYIGYHED